MNIQKEINHLIIGLAGLSVIAGFGLWIGFLIWLTINHLLIALPVDVIFMAWFCGGGMENRVYPSIFGK